MLLTVENLTFDYPGFRALHDVSFDIPAGTITGLVGPNGAGKTTLLRNIAALEVPFSGRVILDGLDVHDEPRACHRRMGYLADDFGLYGDLSVEQCLRHAAAAQGLPPREERPRALKAADRLGLGDRLTQRAGTLSRGLRQRVAIAQAILHDPPLVLMDEPASGLDPEARLSLAHVLAGLAREGMTLVVSSHILAELQDYASPMLLLLDGRVVRHVPISAAEGEETTETARVLLRMTHAFEGLADALSGQGDVEILRAEDAAAELRLPAGAERRQNLLAALVAAGVPVSEFTLIRPDMHQAYLAGLRGDGEEPRP